MEALNKICYFLFMNRKYDTLQIVLMAQHTQNMQIIYDFSIMELAKKVFTIINFRMMT